MKYLKEVYNDFKVVPFKKFMTFLFFLSCILGYVVMALFPYFASHIIKCNRRKHPSIPFNYYW